MLESNNKENVIDLAGAKTEESNKEKKEQKDTIGAIEDCVKEHFGKDYQTKLLTLVNAQSASILSNQINSISSSTGHNDDVTLKHGDGEDNYEIDTIKGDDAHQTNGFFGKRMQGCRGLSKVVCKYPPETDTVTWKGKVKEEPVITYRTETIPNPNDPHGVIVRIYQKITYIQDVHFITFRYIRCCCRWLFKLFRFPGDCWVEYIIDQRGIKERLEVPGVEKVITETNYRNISESIIDAVITRITGAVGDAAGTLTQEQLDKLIKDLKKELKRLKKQ